MQVLWANATSRLLLCFTQYVIWCLCSNKRNWTVAQYLSDHYKQFILNTFHNSPFVPAIVGKITALASVTLEQGLWKCPNMNIKTTGSKIFQFFNSSCNVTTLDYITDFYTQKHAQKVTVHYPEHNGFQRARQEQTSYSREYWAKTRSFIMLDNTLMITECLSFSATYSTFVYLILLYYILYILIQNTRL